MHCFDCTSTSEPVPAVGICTTCGAAVCRTCARVGVQTVRHITGFSSAELALTETRKITCPPCADALSLHHASRYRFATLTEDLAEMK
jgi:hypothetical protein